MSLRVRVASGIVCVALLAGCGGSGKSASPATTTTVSPTTTVVPSTPRQLAADRATARRAVLTLADLPHGFLGTPHDNSSNTPIPPPVEQQFVTCAHLPKALAAHLLDDKPDPTAPSVDSDDFSLPSADDKTVTQVQNNVEIHRTAHELVAAFGVLANPATTACWRALFLAAAKEASPPGGTAALTAVTLTRRPGIGDQAAVVHVVLRLTQGPRSENLSLAFYFVRKGRAAISVEVSGIGTTPTRAFGESLAQRVVGRLTTVG